jgi:hypothetical protein
MSPKCSRNQKGEVLPETEVKFSEKLEAVFVPRFMWSKSLKETNKTDKNIICFVFFRQKNPFSVPLKNITFFLLAYFWWFKKLPLLMHYACRCRLCLMTSSKCIRRNALWLA